MGNSQEACVLELEGAGPAWPRGRLGPVPLAQDPSSQMSQTWGPGCLPPPPPRPLQGVPSPPIARSWTKPRPWAWPLLSSL